MIAKQSLDCGTGVPQSKVRPRRLTKIQVSMKPVKFAFTDIFMVKKNHHNLLLLSIC